MDDGRTRLGRLYMEGKDQKLYGVARCASCVDQPLPFQTLFRSLEHGICSVLLLSPFRGKNGRPPFEPPVPGLTLVAAEFDLSAWRAEAKIL